MFEVIEGIHKGRDLVGPSEEPLLQRLSGGHGCASALSGFPSPMDLARPGELGSVVLARSIAPCDTSLARGW